MIAGLSRLRDRLGSRVDATTAYRFGARDLVLHHPADDLDALPRGGLVTTVPGAAAVHLHVLSPVDVDSLSFPDRALMGPYGAIVDSANTPWLVLRSPDTGRMLALDTINRVALYFPGARVPPRDRAEFCRPLLHWLAILDGHVVIHGGGVALDGRGLLVAGAGNAGKSTLTRLCLEAGFQLLGDNVVEVSLGGAPVIYPVYPTFKIRRSLIAPIPTGWPSPEWDDEAEKDIYFLGGGPSTISPGPVTHVATLILDPEASPDIVPMSRQRAFFLIAPNTVAQFPFYEETVLKRAGAVLGNAPSFLAGRMPLESITERIAGLLDVSGECQ
jgi:hypothetical protein